MFYFIFSYILKFQAILEQNPHENSCNSNDECQYRNSCGPERFSGSKVAGAFFF